MKEFFWIFVSFALLIGWLYAKDSIRTDRDSGNMDIYTFIIAFSGVGMVFRFMEKYVYEKTNIKPHKLYVV